MKQLTKTQHTRLMRLIKFMESLPKSANKHFNMGSFLYHSGPDDHGIPEKPEDLHTCGTVACAMGWAATMPYFRKLGCRFDKHGQMLKMGVIVKTGSAKWGDLFSGASVDPTPKAWAKRARSLIAEWGVRKA